MNSAPSVQESPRRPTRVRAQIPLRIRSLDSDPAFSEDGHTLVVNPNGCGIRLQRSLEPGCRIMLEQLPGGNQAAAVVANCVPLGKDGKHWLLGVVLEKPANVWCIYPAPADWGDQPQPATPVPLPKRTNEWPYSIFSASGEAHPGRD